MVAFVSVVTSVGTALSAAVWKLWNWVEKRVADCESDRQVLHGKIEGMNAEMRTITRSIGQMEGKLSSISIRTDHIEQTEQNNGKGSK
jgi:hypothetical protein